MYFVRRLDLGTLLFHKAIEGISEMRRMLFLLLMLLFHSALQTQYNVELAAQEEGIPTFADTSENGTVRSPTRKSCTETQKSQLLLAFGRRIQFLTLGSA